MVACRQQNEMGHFLGSGEPAGDVLLIPAGTIHPVKNVGSGNGAELATYVVEKGKLLIMLVKDQKVLDR